jgi:hypothetical protein
MVHVVYCDKTGKRGEHVLDLILSGKKTMIIRSASGRKIPHSRVFEDEILYFMEQGSSLITAKARITSVKNYVRLSEKEINHVFADNEKKLCLTDKQKERWHKKCICLIEFDRVEAIDPALPFEKQANMDDWLIIEKIEDVLVGTSIPYNYDNSKF